mmetsp:Transcript_135333/g.234685  ORF Transcript_135333/g.234685 Transcript_135333/m.234685 type:complete len:86 (+) Transcript_135333:388-645(+)
MWERRPLAAPVVRAHSPVHYVASSPGQEADASGPKAAGGTGQIVRSRLCVSGSSTLNKGTVLLPGEEVCRDRMCPVLKLPLCTAY